QTKQSFQPLAMIDAEQQIAYGGKLWQKWQNLSFQKILPDFAPEIANFPALQETASEKTYQFLTTLLSGKYSIRDLAVQKQTDCLTFLRSISPYIQLGDIELLEIPDIPYPIAIPQNKTDIQPNIEHTTDAKQLLIACVALSPVMSQVMAKVATVASYKFIGESDSMEAMPLLLNCKPDLIFLDIELPGLSGYEICTQLRQLEYFSKTPIILFGRNIGLIERMKSKMSGASEIFQQSMDVQSIFGLVKKYGQLVVSG
ncbi:response regulator, partial [Hyella patelloides]